MIREACVEGLTQSLWAEKAGAGRIELCENLAVGGTTPSLGTVIICKKYLKIPVIVMIRPRGGNFVYSTRELEVMAQDIIACREAGADGIAIGLLTPKNEIDLDNLHKIAEYAGNMQITFHKAIDVTSDIQKEFLKLCRSKLVTRVLTSGGADTALEGAPMLQQMIQLSENNTRIVVAGKVTYENLPALSKLIPADEFHGKKIVGDLS
jgi:copper homeostasis protein